MCHVAMERSVDRPDHHRHLCIFGQKADRLSFIIAELMYFRPKNPTDSRTFCHSNLCFHIHSRVDLHF
jgi:hypothetical protein